MALEYNKFDTQFNMPNLHYYFSLVSGRILPAGSFYKRSVFKSGKAVHPTS